MCNLQYSKSLSVFAALLALIPVFGAFSVKAQAPASPPAEGRGGRGQLAAQVAFEAA
jgi:hypothetical protein